MPAPRSLLKGFERVVATTKPDPTRRITISDPDTRGLYLRVMPSGHKSYTVVARDPRKKQVWTSLGGCDEIALEDARTKARELVRQIKAGEGSIAKAAAAAPDSFEEVYKNFILRHVEKKELRSAGETKRIFKQYILPRWKDRNFTSIRRSDVTSLLDEIEDGRGGEKGNLGGPVMADRVLAALSKLCSWHATRNDDYVSPVVKGMRRAVGRSRERILSDEEIKLLWRAASDAGGFGAFLKLCLLTAQRRAKVMTMQWSQLEGGTWTIPSEDREKATAGELRLPAAALAIIEAQPRVKDNPFVFAGRGKKGMYPGDKLKKDFDEAIAKLNGGEAIAPWTIHDLRRTAKSLMAEEGVLPHISERVLGHAIAGVEGTYDRASYAAAKAQALKKLAARIDRIVNPTTAKVVPLRAAK